MTERALLLNQLKNLKKSLKHFKRRARSFDEEALVDLLHEMIQILELHEVTIFHIEEAVALKKAETAESRKILELHEVIISHIEEAVALKKAEIAESRNQTR